MKRIGIIVALVILLLIGGGLTTQLIARQESGIMPVLRTVESADASVLEMVPWKAEQLFLAIGFILFNLIGMAVTIAVVVWLLDRAMRRSRAEAPKTTTAAPARAERASAPENTTA